MMAVITNWTSPHGRQTRPISRIRRHPDRHPPPPIRQTGEPFDSTAEPGVVVMHSIPGFRHYNPIGSVHGGYAAILLDSAMGLAVHTALPAGTGYTTLEFKISFIKGMTEDTGPVRSEGRSLNVGRRTATAE